MEKPEVIARLKRGLRTVTDKRIHAMVDLEINRIKNMSSSEFTSYL